MATIIEKTKKKGKAGADPNGVTICDLNEEAKRAGKVAALRELSEAISEATEREQSKDMVICLCATRNMYPQLQQSITMLLNTQPNLKKIYAFVEDDMGVSNNVEFINVSNYEPIIMNEANKNNKWTYMILTRCYFTNLLPAEDKVLYLDLDIMIEKDIAELWRTDVEGYAAAGVIDTNVRLFTMPYIQDKSVYVNSGVLLMNLKYIREHALDREMDKLLNSYTLMFPDQDVINIVCFGKIKCMDPKWNSGGVTSVAEDPMIHHLVAVKPWDPMSAWFPKWASTYIATGAKTSVAVI